MESNIHYTAVGAFVIGLMICVIMTILWLSSGFFNEENFSLYKVYMRESVSGLSVDSTVEYNGVVVGTVKTWKATKVSWVIDIASD